MALDNNDYVEILAFLRQVLQESRLGALDEKLVNQLQGSDDAYSNLVHYLKLLSSEASLRTGDQLRSVMARFREVVDTESGEPIQGIRVALSEADRRVFQTDHMDLEPEPEAQQFVGELHQLIDDLHNDRNQRPESGDRE